METATVYGKQLVYTSVFYDIIIKLIMQCRLRALCRGLRRTAIDRRRIILAPWVHVLVRSLIGEI